MLEWPGHQHQCDLPMIILDAFTPWGWDLALQTGRTMADIAATTRLNREMALVLLSLAQALPLQLRNLLQQLLSFLVIHHGQPDPRLPIGRNEDLTQLALLALNQVKRRMLFPLRTMASGLAAFS